MDKPGRDYSVDISEIVRLPNASEAEDVLNSPLFKVANDKPGYRMLYHRSLGELLDNVVFLQFKDFLQQAQLICEVLPLP